MRFYQYLCKRKRQTLIIMSYKKGDKVMVLNPQFKEMWLDKNVWVIDDVRKDIGKYDVLYACHNVYDSSATQYHFKECDVKAI